MARTSASTNDGAFAGRAIAAHPVQVTRNSSAFKYVPGFVYILIFYVAGKYVFPDPRATLVQWGEYHLSWVEVLMVGAAMMAMAEQLRVSHLASTTRLRLSSWLQSPAFRYSFSLSERLASKTWASSTTRNF